MRVHSSANRAGQEVFLRVRVRKILHDGTREMLRAVFRGG
jgi:hypothetical protein